MEEKKGPGRPRSTEPTRRRIDVTISEEAYQFLRWLADNQSKVVDEGIKQHPLYPEWKQKQKMWDI